jgi:hypothetical protein
LSDAHSVRIAAGRPDIALGNADEKGPSDDLLDAASILAADLPPAAERRRRAAIQNYKSLMLNSGYSVCRASPVDLFLSRAARRPTELRQNRKMPRFAV